MPRDEGYGPDPRSGIRIYRFSPKRITNACGRWTLARYNRPILVGVSRKSMVWRPLDLTPETCLEATQALQLYALEHGATILRTHDVATPRDHHAL